MSRIVDVDRCPDRDAVRGPTPSASERVLSPMRRVRAYVLCTKCVVVSLSVLCTVWAMALAGLYTEFVQCRGPHAPPPCRRPSRAASMPSRLPPRQLLCPRLPTRISAHTHSHTQHTLRLPVKSAHTDTRAHTSLNQRPDIAMLDSERCPLSHTCSARYSARGPSSSRCSVHSPTSCPLTSPCSLK